MKYLKLVVLNLVVPYLSFSQPSIGAEPLVSKKGVSESAEIPLNFNPTFQYSEREINKVFNLKENGMAIFCVFDAADFSPNLKLEKVENNIVIDKEFQDEKGVNEVAYKQKRNFLTFNKAFKKSKLDINLTVTPEALHGRSNTTFGELLVLNSFLNKKQIQKIESYFSLKYGISLPKDKDYYNGKGNLIFKNDKWFSNRLTCIGRDDASGLNQKQSGNVEDEFNLSFSIGAFKELSEYNKVIIKDGSYLIWADNGNDYSFIEEDDHVICEKQWKLKNISDFEFNDDVYIRIDKSILASLKNHQDLYLGIDTRSNKEFNLDNSKEIQFIENGNFLEAIVSKTFLENSEDLIFTMVAKIPQQLSEDIVNIYPNPVLENQIFDIEIKNMEPYDFQIFDIKGQTIKYSENNIEKVSEKITSPGLYTILITQDGKQLIKKIIVQ
ncbi:MAG: hypothetical protein RLZZ546_2317 [Bacteroidota bacterium]|jgi:hypothetical protein